MLTFQKITETVSYGNTEIDINYTQVEDDFGNNNGNYYIELKEGKHLLIDFEQVITQKDKFGNTYKKLYYPNLFEHIKKYAPELVYIAEKTNKFYSKGEEVMDLNQDQLLTHNDVDEDLYNLVKSVTELPHS